MKVGELIKELQKLHKELDVTVADHDMCDHWTSGDVYCVTQTYEVDIESGEFVRDCVILHC